jgi:4,5-dihydroxyphthalate decarboxylase
VAKLKLRVLAGEYEIVRALREKRVEADGIELDFIAFPGTREIHQMIASGDGFDIGEFNAGGYMANRAFGGRFTAIPVFLHRRFRHGFVFVNSSRGIEKPTDLIGKRVGGTNFAPAGNIWVRGILENDHGVPHRTITWVTERDEDSNFDYHPDLRVERIAPGRDLDDMLAAGELDATISPSVARGIREGDPRVGRLWPDYKDIEIAYFQATGIFPIMHVTIVREDIVRDNPWAVKSLLDAFEAAKQDAYRRLVNPRIVPLAFYQSAWEEQRELLGPDPWEYGLTPANRRNLETMARYVRQQGMTDRVMTLEELFPAEAFV